MENKNRYQASLKKIRSLADIDTDSERESLLRPVCSSSDNEHKLWSTPPLPSTYIFYDSEISDIESSKSNINNNIMKKEDLNERLHLLKNGENNYSYNIRRTHCKQNLNRNYHSCSEHLKYDQISSSEVSFHLNLIPNGSNAAGLYCTASMLNEDAARTPSIKDNEAGGMIPKKQNSLVTIFSIWNTMVGTSLLAMPWGMERSGLPAGFIIAVIMGGICLYTAYCNIDAHKQHGSADDEVFQLNNQLLGPWAEKIAKIFSYIVLLGAVIIYWILMSNFFNFSVDFFYSLIFGHLQSTDSPVFFDGVLCPSQTGKMVLNVTSKTVESFTSNITSAIHNDSINKDTINFADHSDTFHRYWNLKTVPIYLAVIIGPLLSFRSPTFFTKFNSLGTMSVMYLMLFVFIKSARWGFLNISFVNKADKHYADIFNNSFGAMSGMLSLSYFIHNIIISLVKNNKHQENNVRDLSIAYILVMLTYTFIGTAFYVAFPLGKSCIEDNLLNNFKVTDTMTVIARVFLFFQLITVYPLIAFMLRSQILLEVMGTSNPSIRSIMCFNVIIVVICILFAIFIPHIGTVIRFTGAISGFIHVFTLPCLLRIASLKKREELTVWSLALNLVIPILGGVNILLQFFIRDK